MKYQLDSPRTRSAIRRWSADDRTLLARLAPRRSRTGRRLPARLSAADRRQGGANVAGVRLVPARSVANSVATDANCPRLLRLLALAHVAKMNAIECSGTAPHRGGRAVAARRRDQPSSDLYAAAKEGQITEVTYMFPKPGADSTPVAKVRVKTH
jgi:hypothetical protein